MEENRVCHACEVRKRERGEAELRPLVNRLNRIEGQVRGVRSMIENDAYCPDVLVQVSAISSALSAFTRELLSSHIRTCVLADIKNGREEAADELAELLRKFVQ